MGGLWKILKDLKPRLTLTKVKYTLSILRIYWKYTSKLYLKYTSSILNAYFEYTLSIRQVYFKYTSTW